MVVMKEAGRFVVEEVAYAVAAFVVAVAITMRWAIDPGAMISFTMAWLIWPMVSIAAAVWDGHHMIWWYWYIWVQSSTSWFGSCCDICCAARMRFGVSPPKNAVVGLTTIKERLDTTAFESISFSSFQFTVPSDAVTGNKNTGDGLCCKDADTDGGRRLVGESTAVWIDKTTDTERQVESDTATSSLSFESSLWWWWWRTSDPGRGRLYWRFAEKGEIGWVVVVMTVEARMVVVVGGDVIIKLEK